LIKREEVKDMIAFLVQVELSGLDLLCHQSKAQESRRVRAFAKKGMLQGKENFLN